MMRDFITLANDNDRKSGYPRAAFLADSRSKSHFFPASELEGQGVPDRHWLVPDLVPSGTVTLLGGDGGTGKSLLALQLAAAVASFGAWVGHAVTKGQVVFISAEDDLDELHRRIAAICVAESQSIADLDNLTLRSLAGEDALLATIQRDGTLVETALFAELDLYLAKTNPTLLVLDTLADLFPGNENDRAQARQFVGMLRGLAIRHECAVMLLSHPSLTGINSGTGTSGSTGWNNSVRSRLYLERVVDDGYEADPDARILSTKKANYGRTGGKTHVIWKGGVFIADAPENGLDRMASNAKAERVFLKLLDLFSEQSRYVSPNLSNAFAPAKFAKHPDAEGISKQALNGAMEALLASGKIKVGEHGRGASKKQHLERGGGNE